MKKRTIIRLTESELMNVITEAVNRCIREDVLGEYFIQKEGNEMDEPETKEIAGNNYDVFPDNEFSTVGQRPAGDQTVYT